MKIKSTSDKTALFETMPAWQAVLKVCIPTIAGTLVMVLYSLADTFFVGKVNDPIQNAAVTLAAPLLMAFNAVNNLFGVGTSSMMGRGLGRKDYDTVARSSSFGFYGAIISGILFAFVYTICSSFVLRILGTDSLTYVETRRYLLWTCSFGAVPAILNVVMSNLVRAEGSALNASIGAMSGCLLNIILDPFFILPQFLNMGAAGAGLATFISNCFACLYFFIFLFIKRGKTFVCINPKRLTLNKEIVIGVLAVGIPAAIQNILNVTGMTIQNNFASGYGSNVVASMGISSKITSISFFVAMAIGQGVMPLLAYNFGAKNPNRMKELLSFTVKLDIGILAVTTSVYMIFAPQLIRMFMNDELIVSYGKIFLRSMASAIPFLCIDFLAVGFFQACGYGKYSLIFAFLRKIILEIPALLILNILIPVYGIGFSQTFAEIGMCIASVFMVRKVFKKIESI